MRKGSLPRSIAQALPEPFGYDFTPDGLDLAAIDELIEQVSADTKPPSRPGWLSADVVEQRRDRRRVRLIVRVLPASLGSPILPADSDGEAA